MRILKLKVMQFVESTQVKAVCYPYLFIECGAVHAVLDDLVE